jgi:threonine dehydrogenase-like Zn-dependent dehydrogenase
MEEGDVLGHEPMSEVVEVGRQVEKLKKGDRVVVPVNDPVRQLLLLRQGPV